MFGQVLDYIARTNLFNFIIFLSVIIYLCVKINVSGKLDDAKLCVDKTIEDSETVKSEAETKLSKIEESVSHIEEEIEGILTDSIGRAKLVGDKILQDAEKSAALVHSNMEKALENSRITIKNDLIKRASLASIEAARAHIINELNNNQELHDRLIEESVEALEGVRNE